MCLGICLVADGVMIVCIFCWKGKIRWTQFCRHMHPLPNGTQTTPKSQRLPTCYPTHQQHDGVERAWGMAFHRPGSSLSFPTDQCVSAQPTHPVKPYKMRTVMAVFYNFVQNRNYRPMPERNSVNISYSSIETQKKCLIFIDIAFIL